MRGYDLVPNPPVSGRPTTLVLYGVYPMGCGVVVSKSDSPVTIRLRSYTACPTRGGHVGGVVLARYAAAGTHTLAIVMTMDRPDSG
jgi:hypothetical protein